EEVGASAGVQRSARVTARVPRDDGGEPAGSRAVAAEALGQPRAHAGGDRLAQPAHATDGRPRESARARQRGDGVAGQPEDEASIGAADPERLARLDGDAVEDALHAERGQNVLDEVALALRD